MLFPCRFVPLLAPNAGSATDKSIRESVDDVTRDGSIQFAGHTFPAASCSFGMRLSHIVPHV